MADCVVGEVTPEPGLRQALLCLELEGDGVPLNIGLEARARQRSLEPRIAGLVLVRQPSDAALCEGSAACIACRSELGGKFEGVPIVAVSALPLLSDGTADRDERLIERGIPDCCILLGPLSISLTGPVDGIDGPLLWRCACLPVRLSLARRDICAEGMLDFPVGGLERPGVTDGSLFSMLIKTASPKSDGLDLITLCMHFESARMLPSTRAIVGSVSSIL